MPVSEPSSALGAWSAWVGFALILLSAIILAIYPATRRLCERLIHRFQYDPSDRPQPEEKAVVKPHSSFADTKKHIIFNVIHFVWKQKQTKRQFSAWWADPVTHSYPEKYNIEDISIMEPECGCIHCNPSAEEAKWPVEQKYEVEPEDVEQRHNVRKEEWL